MFHVDADTFETLASKDCFIFAKGELANRLLPSHYSLIQLNQHLGQFIGVV